MEHAHTASWPEFPPDRTTRAPSHNRHGRCLLGPKSIGCIDDAVHDYATGPLNTHICIPNLTDTPGLLTLVRLLHIKLACRCRGHDKAKPVHYQSILDGELGHSAFSYPLSDCCPPPDSGHRPTHRSLMVWPRRTKVSCTRRFSDGLTRQ